MRGNQVEIYRERLWVETPALTPMKCDERTSIRAAGEQTPSYLLNEIFAIERTHFSVFHTIFTLLFLNFIPSTAEPESWAGYKVFVDTELPACRRDDGLKRRLIAAASLGIDECNLARLPCLYAGAVEAVGQILDRSVDVDGLAHEKLVGIAVAGLFEGVGGRGGDDDGKYFLLGFLVGRA